MLGSPQFHILVTGFRHPGRNDVRVLWLRLKMGIAVAFQVFVQFVPKSVCLQALYGKALTAAAGSGGFWIIEAEGFVKTLAGIIHFHPVQ